MERINIVVETTQRTFSQNGIEAWDTFLPLVEFSINSNVSPATGFTPLSLNQGYHSSDFLDILVDRTPAKVHALEQWLQGMDCNFAFSPIN